VFVVYNSSFNKLLSHGFYLGVNLILRDLDGLKLALPNSSAGGACLSPRSSPARFVGTPFKRAIAIVEDAIEFFDYLRGLYGPRFIKLGLGIGTDDLQKRRGPLS